MKMDEEKKFKRRKKYTNICLFWAFIVLSGTPIGFREASDIDVLRYVVMPLFVPIGVLYVYLSHKYAKKYVSDQRVNIMNIVLSLNVILGEIIFYYDSALAFMTELSQTGLMLISVAIELLPLIVVLIFAIISILFEIICGIISSLYQLF